MKKGATIECFDTKKTTAFGGCSSKPIYGTHQIPLLKYCIPNLDQLNPIQLKQVNTIETYFETSIVGKHVTDLFKARWTILSSVGICLVLTFIYIQLMSKCATCLAWFSILAVQVGLIGMGFLCYTLRSDD